MEDKSIIQELARKYMEIAALEINAERRERMSKTNDLVSELRPSVLIEEVPWHEMNVDNQLTLRCEGEFARGMEWFFRTVLFRWKYFQADMVVEPYYPIHKSFSSTGNGLEVHEETVATDSRNNIISHAYIDALDTFEKVAAMKKSIITAYPERDLKNMEMAQELLGGIVPVKLRGTEIYYAPWDQIARMRGVEQILFDMVDEPELLHAIIKSYTEDQLGILLQFEEQNLLEPYLQQLHCTPAYTHQLPAQDFNGHARLKDVWFRSMAQMFSSVSPAMHEEFELQYMRPLMARCGMVYYGCCEPLDNKLDMLMSIPNMRKLGVSPWANQEVCGEKMGGKYVFARKPNPAFVAGDFSEETVRKEAEETIKICLKYGCPYEMVLKDISTVGYKPENLFKWNKVVQETIDSFYA